jgi:glycosyltransferase involved in cell wall biosynthesis
MTEKKPFRLAVVNSHPIQYFAPLYAYLNRDPDIEVTALYCSDYSLRGAVDPGFKQQVKWDVDLLSGYRHVFLGERARKRSITGFWSLICPEVWREIRSGRYDAVWLHGYAYAAYVLAFLAAKSRRLPVFVRSETHLGLKRSGWRQRLRDGILRRAYRRVDGCLAIGSANREYYRSLGVPDSKIFDVPYTVDNDRFIAAANITPAQRQQVRSKFGLRDGQPVVLYASKFMRRKHPDDVISAIARLHDEGIKASLLLVGTGEMETELRAQVERFKVQDVVFGGFVNQAELPQVYAACDIFVLPSESEPWGLIVNEVMCAGLPVVVSDEVGCVPDLVKDGVNGKLVRAGDVGSLTTALRDLLGNPQRTESAGQQSLQIIRNWSYAQCLQGARSAIQHVQAAA